MRKYNFISLVLLIIIILFGLKYRLKNFIKWEKDNIYWDNFTKIDSIEGGYDAYILTQIKVQGEPMDSDFEVYALMDPNDSRKIADTLSDNQLLIHEKYHFNITEYHARLLRKEIIAIGKEKLKTDKLKSLHIKYLKLANKMQDEYDRESEHNKVYEKQRYWELKVDDLLRQTTLYKNTQLNSYYNFNPEKTNYFKKVLITFNNEILSSYPIKKTKCDLGEVYQVNCYKDSIIIKYYKNGRNINGGEFGTAIFKLKKEKNRIEKHYLNSNNSYNNKLKHQIEISVKIDNEDLSSTFYNSKMEVKGNKVTWKKIDNNTYLSSFYNQQNKQVSNKEGIFHIKKENDSIGRLLSIEYLTKDSLLCISKESLYAAKKFRYDKNHNIINEIFLNNYGAFAEHLSHYNILYHYDSFGNLKKMINLNQKSKKIEDHNGVCIYNYDYDSFGNIIQTKRYNRNYTPILGSEDFFKSVEDYTNENKLLFKANYYFNNTLKFNEDDKWGATRYEYVGDSLELRYNVDVYNQCFNDDTGIASVKHYLNKDGYSLKIQYLDVNGSFAKTKDNVVQYVNKYDSINNNIEQITLDSLGNKIAFSEDVATIKWSYNDRNLKVKTSYYDLKNELANANQGASFDLWRYDEEGRVIEYKNLGKNNEPIEIDGIHKTKYIYNRFGKDSIVKYYNKKNELIDGVASIKYKYNNYGTLIEEAYYNSNRLITLNSDKISYKRFLLNKKQQIIGCRFYDKNFRRTNNKYGYHYEKIGLNEYGYTTSFEYFDVKNRRVLNSEGFHKIESKKDSLGEEIEYSTYDIYLKLKENSSGIAKYEFTRAKSGIVSSIKNYNKKGKLTNDEEGVAETYYESYLNGLYYIDRELDENGHKIKKSKE